MYGFADNSCDLAGNFFDNIKNDFKRVSVKYKTILIINKRSKSMKLNKKDASSPSIDHLKKESSLMSDMDQRYMQMIQLVHLLGSAFVSPHFLKGDNALDDTFSQLVRSLNKLALVPGHNGGILIREKAAYGSQLTRNVSRYTIQLSNIILNTEVAAEVARRLGSSVTQLLRKLQIAFDIFSLMGIHDLYLRIPNGSVDNLEQIRISLEILSHFDQAVQSGSDIVYHVKDQKDTVPVIKGLHGQVDPNLTLVAALNNLSVVDMEEINKKVTHYIEQHPILSNSKEKYNIFTVMFHVKDIKEKLILPPIEVNNTKFRMADIEVQPDAAPKKNTDRHANPVNSSNKVSANLSTLKKENIEIDASDVDEKVDDQKQLLELTEPVNEPHQIANSEESDDVDNADSFEKNPPSFGNQEIQDKENNNSDGQMVYVDGFVNKLNEVTDLLASLENTIVGEEILNSIAESLQEYLDQLKIGAKDDVTNETDGSLKIVGKFHSCLSSMFSRLKKRSKSEITALPSNRKWITFQNLDHSQIADRFNLTIPETEKILQILEGCFDSKGHFIRFEFENRIPKFIAYEGKIFEFLWDYLDKPLHRKDRVAFINSLHLLISNMSKPQNALFFLLDELCQDPSKISYSDRNAFMLASLLLRSYNKELSVDIELTPGEVLLVKDGLNKEILHFASMRVENDKDLIKKKIDTIHHRLINAFNKQKPKSIAWAPHFLLSLEREAFIFLSLVAGEPARQLLITALSEYGNPESKIYSHNLEEKDISLLLQHLKLLIRGLGRIGDIEDIEVLADLKKNKAGFIAMHATSQHRKNVNQVFKMIDISMGNITSLQ